MRTLFPRRYWRQLLRDSITRQAARWPSLAAVGVVAVSLLRRGPAELEGLRRRVGGVGWAGLVAALRTRIRAGAPIESDASVGACLVDRRAILAGYDRA